MDNSCINKSRHHVKDVESKTGSSLHKVNIIFTSQGIAQVFQREISKEFFG